MLSASPLAGRIVLLSITAVLIGAAMLAWPAAAAAQATPQRLDAWQVIGMGGGGTTVQPVISPFDANLALLHCDMTGGYITHNAGLSWRMFNLGTGISQFAFDPSDRNVIYAANVALWRSSDQGKTWTMLYPDPAKNTVVHMRGDHSSFELTSDEAGYTGGEGEMSAVAIDAKDSTKIYIARGSNLLVSNDSGKSWAAWPGIANPPARVLLIDAGHDGLTVVTPEGVMVNHAQDAWTINKAPAGSQLGAASCGIGAGGQLVIYALSQPAGQSARSRGGNGLLVTHDLGKTWESAPVNLGLENASTRPARGMSLGPVACSALHADTVYVGFTNYRPAGAPAWGYCGIAKSTDAGKSWSVVMKEGAVADPNEKTCWIEARDEDNVRVIGRPDPNLSFVAPYSLGVAPTQPDVCYATDLFRTTRTLDGGKSWTTVSSKPAGKNGWTTTGLDVTTCYGVHFDPIVKDRLFISYTDMGMFRSEDGGASWISSTVGIPEDCNTTYWLAMDPDVKDLLWGAFSGVHDIPKPKMWRNRDISRGYSGGVAVSTDGGATWTPTSKGMAQTATTHILLDPTSPKGNRTLYACGFGSGVWKSVDNGQSWTLKNKGLDWKEPFAWRITRANDATLYLLVSRRSEGWQGTDPAQDGALLKSTDGADSWIKMALPKDCVAPYGLTLDPRDNKRMYLAAWGRETQQGGDVGGGIWLSEDAGNTWTSLESEDQHIYDVTLDPKNPDILYACGFDSAAYRSADRGATWTRLKGYNFKWGHRVIPDIYHPDMVYITTFGGSVWHGPATGDPNAPEDWQPKLPKKP